MAIEENIEDHKLFTDRKGKSYKFMATRMTAEVKMCFDRAQARY